MAHRAVCHQRPERNAKRHAGSHPQSRANPHVQALKLETWLFTFGRLFASCSAGLHPGFLLSARINAFLTRWAKLLRAYGAVHRTVDGRGKAADTKRAR